MEKVIIRNIEEKDIESVVDIQITGWKSAYKGIGTKLFQYVVNEFISKNKTKILSALEDNKNYTYTDISNDSKKIKKIKDDVIIDYEEETGKYIFFNESKKVFIGKVGETGKYVKFPYTDATKSIKDFLSIEALLKIHENGVYHIKDEKYNEKTCHVIELKKENFIGYTIWVDVDTGFVLKSESDTEKKNSKLNLIM